jgi:hypothetical protein
MSAAACLRCGESLRNPDEACGFCIGERRHEAVTTLVAAATSTSSASLAARADAIDTLRNLGYSKDQVIEARAKALDGFSVEEILEGLVEAGEVVVA